jgi:hypothetical protein
MYISVVAGQLAVVAGWGDGNCWLMSDEMAGVDEEMSVVIEVAAVTEKIAVVMIR